MSWEFSRVLFLSRITIDRFSACFLSCSPRCSEPAQGLLTSSLSRMPKLMKWRWIHFSLWRKNILTRTVSLLYFWEDGSGTRTAARAVFVPSTHTLGSFPRTRGGFGKVQPPRQGRTLSSLVFFLFSVLHFSSHSPSSPSPHHRVTFFPKGSFNCNFKMTKRQYPLHRTCVHCSCVHPAHHCGDMR